MCSACVCACTHTRQTCMQEHLVRRCALLASARARDVAVRQARRERRPCYRPRCCCTDLCIYVCPYTCVDMHVQCTCTLHVCIVNVIRPQGTCHSPQSAAHARSWYASPPTCLWGPRRSSQLPLPSQNGMPALLLRATVDPIRLRAASQSSQPHWCG